MYVFVDTVLKVMNSLSRLRDLLLREECRSWFDLSFNNSM
jgi:hypothetical protein